MTDQASRRPLGSVSLDLDNLWSYMKIHGNEGWQQRPSYLDAFVPHVLRVLDQLDLRITFFIVGIDAAQEENRVHLQSIVDAGHEIGNHSFEHESWLQHYTRPELETEISRAQEVIELATGVRPVGFRGPGFSWSPTLLEVLAEQGFTYDASTLPMYLGPIARTYYFSTAKLSPEERKQRKELFGRFRDGLRPSGAYQWQLEDSVSLLEIPVTTMPILKLPFHFSYLLYLSRISPFLMDRYLDTAMLLCRVTRTEPSFLLHPLDLIGGDQVPALKFFPGMDVSSEQKVELFERALGRAGQDLRIGPHGGTRPVSARSGRPSTPGAGKLRDCRRPAAGYLVGILDYEVATRQFRPPAAPWASRTRHMLPAIHAKQLLTADTNPAHLLRWVAYD